MHKHKMNILIWSDLGREMDGFHFTLKNLWITLILLASIIGLIAFLFAVLRRK